MRSTSPDPETPSTLRRAGNATSSLANSLSPSLQSLPKTVASRQLSSSSQAESPRRSVLRNGEVRKGSPQLSNGLHTGTPDTPRHSILKHGDVNGIHHTSYLVNSPRESVVRIDEPARTNSLPVLKNAPNNTPRHSVHMGTDHPPNSRHSSVHRISISRHSVMRIGHSEGHHGNRPYNILMDFLIFCVTSLEVLVVLMLAILHFQHEDGLMAITMLLPIVLNCVGVVYFLSDKTERLEMEKAGRITCLTDFLQFPILGPVFTAFKVLSISCGCSRYNNYERMEAIAVKLRQSGGFFSGAPETLIILTVLFSVEQDEDYALTAIQYLEMWAVLLFVFTLAESNCYGSLSNYYKMWTDHESRDWSLEHVHLWQKLLLFLHSFTSIASKMIAAASLKSAAVYFWRSEDLPVVLITVVFAEIGTRVIIHYVCRQLKFLVRDREVPSSCYESINYGWRATVLNYGFQSENLFVQCVFYLENLLSFGVWMFCAHRYADIWVIDLLIIPICILFNSITILSIILLITCSRLNLIKVHSPLKHSKPLSEEAKSRIIHEFARSISVPEPQTYGGA